MIRVGIARLGTGRLRARMTGRTWWLVPGAVLAALLLAAAAISPGTAWAATPTVDPFEPNDTTATATPISADGAVFIGYYDFDQAGDYLSFSVRKGHVYHVRIAAQGYGCWGWPSIYHADGTEVVAMSNLAGSAPWAQWTEVDFSATSDETVYLGYLYMSAARPPAPLLPYEVTVTEHEYPVVEGTVRDATTGLPIEGALVRAWLGASFSAYTNWPYQQADYQEALTGADGAYRFTFQLPGDVCLRFEDPNGRLLSEWYDSTSLAFSRSVVTPGRLLKMVPISTDGRYAGIDGVLRHPGTVEVHAVRADTGEDLPGARLQLSTFQGDDIDGSIYLLPETDASGITGWSGLDSRIPHTLVGWNAPLPVTTAELAGFRLVGLSRGWFTPVEGGTTTVTATYELISSDVALDIGARVARGSKVVATATVVWVGSPAPSVAVELQGSADGAAWTTVSSGVTDPSGRLRFEIAQTANAVTYRAVVRGTHDIGAGQSAVASTELRTLGGYWCTGMKDAPISVTAPDLVADARSAGLSGIATLAVSPTHGTLSLDPLGGFVYVPSPGFTGRDEFGYRLWDGTSYSDAATVSITVLSATEPCPDVVVAVIRSVDPTSGASGTRLNLVAGDCTDAQGHKIVTYSWASNIAGVIAESAVASASVSDLPAGIHTISLRVRCSAGTWSDSVAFGQVVTIAQAPAVVQTSLSLRRSSAHLRCGAYLRLSGVLTGGVRAGAHVRYQVKAPGKRTFVTFSAYRDISASGYSSAKYRCTRRGTYYFRAVFPGRTGFSSSVSRVVKTVVR